MSSKILLVDDEQNILEAFKRQLKNDFAVETATSGERALTKIADHGPFAVVVSDMRMPGMNGIQLLSEIKQRNPDTIRVMLTGNQDQETALHAVNDGNVFRFLVKPCTIDDLSRALREALAQHQLITAEKELLQNTLSGSIKLLTDILSITDPLSFHQALKLREQTRAVAQLLQLPNLWEHELSAMLSNIGYTVIPSEITKRFHAREHLSETEQALLIRVPEFGRNLVTNIPRLGKVAESIYYQAKNFDGSGFPQDAVAGEQIPITARILRICKDLLGSSSKDNYRSALREMLSKTTIYDPRVLKAVFQMMNGTPETPVAEIELSEFSITVADLCVGQKILADVLTTDGKLLLSAGNIVTDTMIERIRNYSHFVGIQGTIRVDRRGPL